MRVSSKEAKRRIYRARWLAKPGNRERQRKSIKRWKKKNRERWNASRRSWRARNLTAQLERERKWARANPDKCRTKVRKWKRKNRKRVTAYHRQWLRKNRERMRQMSRNWKGRNPEKNREISRAWQQANREYVRELNRVWRKDHPDQVRATHQRRYGRSKGQLHPQHDRAKETKLLLRCARLTRQTGISHHIDHIIPLAKGGWHHHQNLQILPHKLNSGKRDSLTWKRRGYKSWRDVPRFLWPKNLRS